jgi:hypothetical protein
VRSCPAPSPVGVATSSRAVVLMPELHQHRRLRRQRTMVDTWATVGSARRSGATCTCRRGGLPAS